MSSKAKKIAATATALALSASLLLGGTYAWQSVNQVALNEASDVVNPGGRLHDDFNGESKDVYVENFATEDIYARIRFDEYMEVVMNYNPNNPSAAQTKTDVITVGATKEDPTTYLTRKFGEDGLNATDAFWNWTMGSADSEQVYYMPTFNVNKDSLRADVNGVFDGANFTITDRDGDQYADYVKYDADSEKTGYEIYDADSDDDDELAVLTDEEFKDVIEKGDGSGYYDGDAVVAVNETHSAQPVGSTKGFISMADWLALGEYSEATHGNYWVYDTDGWVYWSSPIKGGEATGLLLDGISLKGVMDDTWYYAINVVAQFVTADDVGKADGTGFYDTTKSATVPTTEAEALLEAIGVQFPEDAGTGGEDGPSTETTSFTLSVANEAQKLVSSDGTTHTITLLANDENGNSVTNVTWSSSNPNVVVSNAGLVSAAENVIMTSAIEESTITAEANGVSQSMVVYLYDRNAHYYEGSLKDDTGTYHGFGSAVQSYIEMPSIDVCVYKEGTSVSEIYTFTIEGNVDLEGMMKEAIEQYNAEYEKLNCTCGSYSNDGEA